MTSRERVMAVLNHEQPDRCPVDFWAERTTLQTLLKYFNVPSENDVLDILNVDLQYVWPQSTLPEPEILPDGSWYTPWGTHLKKAENEHCDYDEYASFPLAYAEDVEDLEKYNKWPDATKFDWEHYSEQIGDVYKKRVCKLPAGGIYEIAWGLRGQEQLLMDMVVAPEIVHYIMDKISSYWCDYIKFALDAAGDKIDIVYTYDDIASQGSLIMSPEMLEEFVYPYHKRVNAVIKSYGKKIIYHSCGAITPVISNIVGNGVNILNPLQPRAKGIDFKKIKETWGDKLVFHGGIDIQYTMPKGTPEEVQEEVKHAVSTLGKDGGYILTTAHFMQNDTPVENIIAMYDTSLR